MNRIKIKNLHEQDPKENAEILKNVEEQQAAQKRQQEELIKAKQAEMEQKAAAMAANEEQKEPQHPKPYQAPKPAPVLDQEHLMSEIKRERKQQRLDQGESESDEEFITPQIEYSTVCNADFAPLICNEFVTDFLDKEGRSNLLDRTEAIDLTRNFCYWVSK